MQTLIAIAMIIVVLVLSGSAKQIMQPGTVLFSENFEGEFPPPGWRDAAYGSSEGGAWSRNDSAGRENFAGDGYCAIADSSQFALAQGLAVAGNALFFDQILNFIAFTVG